MEMLAQNMVTDESHPTGSSGAELGLQSCPKLRPGAAHAFDSYPIQSFTAGSRLVVPCGRQQCGGLSCSPTTHSQQLGDERKRRA